MLQLAERENHKFNIAGVKNVKLEAVAPTSYIVLMHESMGRNNQMKHAPKSP